MVEFDYGPYGRPEERGMAQDAVPSDVHHTELIVDRLRATRPWVLLMSITGFIGGAFMVLVAGILVFGVAVSPGASEGPQVMAIVFGGAFYGFLGAFCFFYAALLIRYFNAIGRVLVTGTTTEVEAAFGAQRTYWKAMGIATIASIVMTILLIGGMVVFSIVIATGTNI